MRMNKQDREDLRNRLRAGRAEVRRRLDEEFSKVDFRSLREQARAAQAAARVAAAKADKAEKQGPEELS